MRKIIGGFAVSLDGYIDGPDGENDWMVLDKDFDFAQHMKQFDTFLIGRKSYEAILKTGTTPYPNIKNYVFSSTQWKTDKSYILINHNIESFMHELKAEKGKDIALYGGAELLTSLLSIGQVDGIIVSVMPVILGAGKRMVKDLLSKVPLTLTGLKRFKSGVIMLYYNVNH